jgi:hypothetical protein
MEAGEVRWYLTYSAKKGRWGVAVRRGVWLVRKGNDSDSSRATSHSLSVLVVDIAHRHFCSRWPISCNFRFCKYPERSQDFVYFHCVQVQAPNFYPNPV